MGSFTSGGSKLYKPITNETGWDSLVNSNFDYLSQHVFNVKSFGAVGDGVTDDTNAIQSTINAVTSGTTGGVVYLPQATYIISKPLTLGNKVWLRGSGMYSTIIQLANSANCHMIRNYPSKDQVEANAEFCAVQDLQLNGNNANNSSGHGILWSRNPSLAKSTNDLGDGTPHHLVQNVFITLTAQDGINQTGFSENRYVNVTTYYAGNYGFNLGTDTFLMECTAAQSTNDGFFLQSPSVRLQGCKAYYNVNGFHISGAGTYGVSLTGCEAQDNNHSGFVFDSCQGVVATGCVADSNSRASSGTYVGYDFFNATNCNVHGSIAFERGVSNGGAGNQIYATQIRSTSTGNQIELTHAGVGGGAVNAAISPSSDTIASGTQNGNMVFVNGQKGQQFIGFSGSITPDPYKGETIIVGTLTAGITVNNAATTTGWSVAHAGSRLNFLFVQDNAGSHTVSWGTQYKPGTWAVNTGANTFSSINFIWDGTFWRNTNTGTTF